jgi:hypothetical protein
MLEILKKIVGFIKNPKNEKIIYYLIMIILFIALLAQCSSNRKLKTDVIISEHNIAALKDTVTTVKNRVGELQQEKIILITSKKTLEDFSKELAAELEKQKGRVIYISNMLAQLKTDNASLRAENKTLKDSLANIIIDGTNVTYLYWDFSKIYDEYNYRVIKGHTAFALDTATNGITSKGSELSNFDINFNLVTGIREDKGKLKIFVKTNYPDLTFTNIEGSLIDPQKSEVMKKLIPQHKWTFGPQVGVGAVYYDGNIKPSIYIGIGGQYTLFGF